MLALPLILVGWSAWGQAPKVEIHGHFRTDSVAIGEVFPYTLSVRYPQELDVLLPDSLHAFSPFELSRREFFPTRTADGLSYDSVVYFLSSFAMDSVQRLTLPVYVTHARDCTALYTPIDSVLLKWSVTELPPDTIAAQNLPLKIDIVYRDVRRQINYPLLAVIAAGILALALAVWALFGKRICRRFLIRRLTVDHARFMNNFDDLAQSLPRYGVAEGSRQLEFLLLVWKQYVELLKRQPFTKLTSTEIQGLVQDEELHGTLRQIDQWIYSLSGERISGLLLEPLRRFAHRCFEERINDLAHG